MFDSLWDNQIGQNNKRFKISIVRVYFLFVYYIFDDND